MADPLPPTPNGDRRSRHGGRRPAVNPYLRSGLVAVAIAVALGLFVVGFYASDTDDEVTLPAEVERIVPSHGALIRPQGDVGADLADTYTGVLLIDGVELPLDQLTVVDELGQVFFNPGPDRDIVRFSPGTHSATVVYWPRDEGRDAAESFTWQFRVG